MGPLRASAVFCEDIREERSGQDTIIGTMSDNLGVPGVPVVIPKLAVFIRGYIETSAKPEAVSAWVEFPWGERIDLGEAPADQVRAAVDDASSKNNPLAGLIFKLVLSPFPVRTFGVVTAMMKVGKREQLCGMLNIAFNPAATVSPLPSSQSQPAAPAS